MKFFTLLSSFFFSIQLNAFLIRGVVTGSKGEKLQYVNVYLKGTTNGTTSNAAGEYILELQPGEYEIVFQHIGYKQHIEKVNLTSEKVINVQLDETQYEIREAVINGNEDPAYEVIRKAIAKRKYFLSAVESYECDAYVKGMQRILEAPDRILGRKINQTGILTGPKNSGIFYLSESVSKLYYKKPNKFHEVVYSSKVSGQANGFTFNSAQNFYFNFYERSITIPFIAQRPFISPLAENTFFYYTFRMLGAYKEGDNLVNKILVTPKRKSDPCFTGILSIIENNWNIHSLEFVLTKSNGIEYVDTLKVTQYFIPVANDIWLPNQQRYDVKAGILGIKGDGYYLGSFKNYKVNGTFAMPTKQVSIVDSVKNIIKQKKAEKKAESKIFTDEIIKIENNANKRDNLYWDSIRPIPLTELEITDYYVKDSIQAIRETKIFKDSTDKQLNKPSPLGILGGYTFRKQYRKIQIRFPSLLGIVNYNTVEGLNLQFKLGIRKDWESGRRLSVEPVFRYGLSNREFNAMASISFRNSQIHSETISLSGGKFISQFNEVQPQPQFGNTWESLVFRLNFMKLYSQYFVRAAYTREIVNGVNGTIAVNYAQRFPLYNTSQFSFFRKVGNEYTANGMDLPIEGPQNITRHNSLRMDVQFVFKPGQKYITRPDVRFRTESKWPQIVVIYKRGIPINNFSQTNFDFLEARIRGEIPMKLLGTMHFRFGGGGFASRGFVDYPDFKHFFGNFLNQGETDLLGFFTVKYYRFSTDKYFAEAHVEHHFGGFLFNKIPGFRKLKLREVVGFHFLYTPQRKDYYQLDVGIENILKIFRVDFIAGFKGDRRTELGARIGMALDFRD
jgi:hypothetical protein